MLPSEGLTFLSGMVGCFELVFLRNIFELVLKGKKNKKELLTFTIFTSHKSNIKISQKGILLHSAQVNFNAFRVKFQNTRLLAK